MGLATIYTRRKRYGELDVADVRELENARLKKRVADRDLDVMKEIAKNGLM